MVERCIRRDPPGPGTEVPLRIEPCVSSIDSPKCFHRQVFRHPSVANNTHNPTVHLALELPEQSLESVEVALREPLQDFHFPSLYSLTGQWQDWFHFFLKPVLLMDGAALSDLFWYWLSPGPEMHQEHIENGARYEEVERTTRCILGISRKAAEELTTRCVSHALGNLEMQQAKLVRLRDLVMPAWGEFYYELVFGAPCPPVARDLIVGNANDVVTALKCCSLRHMEKRERLTNFLIRKLQAGEVPHALPEGLPVRERALYLQGAFFNTAVVQMSEAMVHLFMVIAQHPEVQATLDSNLEDDRYLDHVIAETLRVYPLFGISHRIASADIPISDGAIIPKNSVLCFNHAAFHRASFQDPDRFDPDRWEKLSLHHENYIPFGVTANRSCPASGLAPVTMRAAAREMLKRFVLFSSASHIRSIPNRGPCLLISRQSNYHPNLRGARLFWLRLRDHWEDVWRSLVQLVLGTYMVLDARRQKLCQHYFEAQESAGDNSSLPRVESRESVAARCPHSFSPDVP